MSDFLSRLVREKPLGAFGGIVVLLLLLVTGIFADVLAPFPMSEPHMLDRLTGPVGEIPAGYRPVGEGRAEPDHLRGACVARRRPGGNQYQHGGGAADRHDDRVLRRQARYRGAAVRRRLDGLPGAAHGFGLPPDVASWGGMLSNDGRRFMELAPWLAIWPGLCLTVVVYSSVMRSETCSRGEAACPGTWRHSGSRRKRTRAGVTTIKEPTRRRSYLATRSTTSPADLAASLRRVSEQYDTKARLSVCENQLPEVLVFGQQKDEYRSPRGQ